MLRAAGRAAGGARLASGLHLGGAAASASGCFATLAGSPAAALPRDVGADAVDRAAAALSAQGLPRFAVPASSVALLPTPDAFYEEVMRAVRRARRRLIVATLYVGTEGRVRERAARSACDLHPYSKARRQLLRGAPSLRSSPQAHRVLPPPRRLQGA